MVKKDADVPQSSSSELPPDQHDNPPAPEKPTNKPSSSADEVAPTTNKSKSQKRRKSHQQHEGAGSSPVTSALSALEGLLAAAFGNDKTNAEDKTNDDETSDQNNNEDDSPTHQDPSSSSRQFVALSTLFNSVVNQGGEDFLPNCFDRRFGGGSRWSTKVTGLECSNPVKQTATLAELSEWLSYANEDSMGGFPADRVVDAIIDILAGRQSKRSSNVEKSVQRRRRRSQRKCTGDEDDWVDLPSVLFGVDSAKEEDDKKEEGKEEVKEEVKVKVTDATSSREPAGVASGISQSVDKMPRAMEVFGQLLEHSEQHEEEDAEEEGEEEEEEEPVEEVRPLVVLEDPFQQATRKVIAANCLHMLLDVAPQSARTAANGDGIQVLCQQLQQIEYIDLAERIVLVLQQLASETPGRLLEQGGLKAMLEFVEFFPIAVQRTVVKASCALLGHIDSKKEYQTLIKGSLAQLGALVLREDEQILQVSYAEVYVYLYTRLFQTICQSFHRLVDFIAREDLTFPGFAAEAFDEMTSQGLASHFVSLMKRAVSIGQPSNGENSSYLAAFLFSVIY